MSLPIAVIATGTHMSGGSMFDQMGWGVMIWWTLLVILVALLIGWAVRSPRNVGPSPLDVLAERFARGEIDAEEYEARRRVLAR